MYSKLRLHFQTNVQKCYALRPIFDSLLGVWNYTRLKPAQNGYVRYFVVFRKAAYSLKTLSTDRNFAVKATATQLRTQGGTSSSSLIIHQVQVNEMMSVTLFGYPNLNLTLWLIAPFSP